MFNDDDDADDDDDDDRRRGRPVVPEKPSVESSSAQGSAQE